MPGKGLHVEADGGDGRHHLPELELVEDRGLSLEEKPVKRPLFWAKQNSKAVRREG